MHIDGGCHCGALAYEAEIDPENVTICHCTDCQQLSGSVFRVAIRAANKDFRLLRGEPCVYVKRGGSGEDRPQAFCSICSSQIYSASVGADADFIRIRLGSCRQRAELKPSKQIWCDSSIPWLADLDTITRQARGLG
jgi:hypothetical protein